MKLDYLSIKQLFETQSQYVVPLYQRTYSWGEKQWQALWEDIECLSEMSDQYHFLGSVVLMEMDTPHGSISKYILIDGQQRLLTIQLLLKVLSKKLKNANTLEIYLTNFSPKAINEILKIYPTKIDHDIFDQIILDKTSQPYIQNQAYSTHLISRASLFFETKINSISDFSWIEKIKNIILFQLKLVYIRLDQSDNAYEIFESLNAKGAPLTQSDLIRNFLFMQFADDEKLQYSIYQDQWLPIQQRLSDDSDSDQITKFIRHYLTMNQIATNEKNVYQVFSNHYKRHLKTKTQFIDLFQDMNKFSIIYQKMINPNYEHDLEIKYALVKIDKIEVTTSYPLLMYLYHLYQSNLIKHATFVEALNLIILYLLRRFVCSYPSNALNKIFSAIVNELKNQVSDQKPFTKEMLQEILYKKNYPTDEEVRLHFPDTKLYQKNTDKTKILLEILEQTFSHKENIIFDHLSIEHIMPQRLSDAWINELERDNQYDENQINHYVHSIGNLTLTAYNSNMSNQTFHHKKNNFYVNSHLELNKQIANQYYQWNVDTIKKRSLFLLDQFLTCFLSKKVTSPNPEPISTLIIPSMLMLNDKIHRLDNQSWKKIFVQVFVIVKNELSTNPNHIGQWALFKSEFNRFIKSERDPKTEEYTRAVELDSNEFLYANMSREDIMRSIKKIFLFLKNQSQINAEFLNQK